MNNEPAESRSVLPGRAAWRSRVVPAILMVVWVIALALPNLAAIPIWSWTPEPWIPAGGDDTLAIASRAAVVALLGSVAMSLLLLGVLGRYGRFTLLTLPLMLLVPAEIWYVVEYGQSSSAHVVGILAESNLAELAEFASGRAVVVITAYAAFVSTAVVAAWSICRFDAGWSPRVRAWTGGLCAALLVVAFSPSFPPLAGANAAPHGDATFVQDSGWWRFWDDTSALFPWGVPVRFGQYVAERTAIRARTERSRSMHAGARFDGSRAALDVVLVIGESARADRFGTGPDAPRTSPRSAGLEGMFSFADVVTPAAATRLAVPRIVTGGLEADSSGAEFRPSIVGTFREAGYRTWWISNHNTVGLHDDTIVPYADEADVRRFENAGTSIGTSSFDGALVGQLERALAAPAARRFVVLHMLGSHVNYRLRYPDEFDRFQPSLRRDQATSIYDATQRELIRNAYDNSILYTDYVLAELVGALARTGRPSALVFVSDHGQALFEGLCGKAGHGFHSALTYRVPLLVWMSPGLRELRPDAMAAFRSHRRTPFTVESVAPTLADLGGVVLLGVPASRSVASETFAPPNRRRVTTDDRKWVDFDRDVPSIDCATAHTRARAPH
ncbi:MAG: phosphoethanolamine transferase [Burkholderiales bacterium]|nr:phosphoethanolamine transferase [Burkholderiales bacterium]